MFLYFPGNYGTEELSQAATCIYSGGEAGLKAGKSGIHKHIIEKIKSS